MTDPASIIRRFGNVEFDLDVLGPALATRREFPRIVSGLLSNGTIVPKVANDLVTWHKSWPELWVAIDGRMRRAARLCYGDLVQAHSAIPTPRLPPTDDWLGGRGRWLSHDPGRARGAPTQSDEIDDLRRRTAPRANEPSDTERRDLDHIYRDVQKRWLDFLERACLQGRILMYEAHAAGFEFIRVEDAAAKVRRTQRRRVERRLVLSGTLPDLYVREKGEGPKTKAKRKLFQDAEAWFVDAIMKTHPFSPWKTKQCGNECMQQLFTGLSGSAFNKIWKQHATGQMKAGRKRPMSAPENPEP